MTEIFFVNLLCFLLGACIGAFIQIDISSVDKRHNFFDMQEAFIAGVEMGRGRMLYGFRTWYESRFSKLNLEEK